MKIALVHEFLNQYGGAERVLENFLEIWPEAETYVLLYDKKKTEGRFEKYKKRISYLNNFPFVRSHYKLLLPLMPKAIESFDFDCFDLVISDSSAFAKGIKTSKLHICYCHTPTRYLWTDEDYIDYQKYPKVLKFLGKNYLKKLKKWDYNAAQRPNFFIANSTNVQIRIKKFYNRDSVVIYPPIDANEFQPVGTKQDYFLAAGRLEPYKKTDLIIEAFNKLGWKLKILGTGSDLNRLKKLSGSNIEFLGYVPDKDLARYYSEAKALIFAAVEDAGIVPLEAQACATPVIAYRAGGSLETIKEGVTGEFFDEQSAESIVEKLKSFDASKYNPETIRENALQYDKNVFQKKIKGFVEEKYENRT
jgi:glycosyltransferase involved in cell wall biosynthesis